MYPYLARIEVHLSSQPVSKNADTVLIADGQVLKQGSLGNRYGLQRQWISSPMHTLSTVASPTNVITPKKQLERRAPDAGPMNSIQPDALLEKRASTFAHSHTDSLASNETFPSFFMPANKRSRTNSYVPPTTPSSTRDSFFWGSDQRPRSRSPVSNFDFQSMNFSIPTAAQGHFGSNDDFNPKSVLLTSRSTPTTYPPLDDEIQMLDSNSSSALSLSDILHLSPLPWDNAPSDLLPTFSIPSSAPTSHPSTVTRFTTRDSCAATVSSDTTSQTDDQPTKDVSLPGKRMKKLETLLETLRTAPTLGAEEHNEKIEKLYNRHEYKSSHLRNLTLVCFAAVLEKLCSMSSTHGFMYGLLNWEIFRQEEERLAREEKLSAIAASKAVNKQMVGTLNRRAKTRDWASDGRKAAKMVFDTLEHRNVTERSFATMLLAANVSLDGMLKIAHFPATRERFAMTFAQIVESMAHQWNLLAEDGYKTFDYEQFLNSRGAYQDVDGRMSSVPTPPPSRSESSIGFYPHDILEHLQCPSGHSHALVSASVDETTDSGMPMSPAWDMSFDFDIPLPTT